MKWRACGGWGGKKMHYSYLSDYISARGCRCLFDVTLETLMWWRIFRGYYLGVTDLSEKFSSLLYQRWEALSPVGCLCLPQRVHKSRYLLQNVVWSIVQSAHPSKRYSNFSIDLDGMPVLSFVFIWVYSVFLHRSQQLRWKSCNMYSRIKAHIWGNLKLSAVMPKCSEP